MNNARGKKLIAYGRQVESTAIKVLSIYFQAHDLVRRKQFRKYLLISGIVCISFFTLSIQLLIHGVNNLKAPVSELVLPYLEKYIALDSEQIKSGIEATFWLIKFAIESNKEMIFSAFFLIIGSPLFSAISAKTEEVLTGKTYPFGWKLFFRQLGRGLRISLYISFKQLGWILIFTLIGLIPVLEIFTPLCIFMVQAYFMGVVMMDYTLERHDLSLKESKTFYKVNKARMFGIGLGFMFLMLIPVVGWFIAPTYALVAAYLQFNNEDVSVVIRE